MDFFVVILLGWWRFMSLIWIHKPQASRTTTTCTSRESPCPRWLHWSHASPRGLLRVRRGGLLRIPSQMHVCTIFLFLEEGGWRNSGGGSSSSSRGEYLRERELERERHTQWSRTFLTPPDVYTLVWGALQNEWLFLHASARTLLNFMVSESLFPIRSHRTCNPLKSL